MSEIHAQLPSWKAISICDKVCACMVLYGSMCCMYLVRANDCLLYVRDELFETTIHTGND